MEFASKNFQLPKDDQKWRLTGAVKIYSSAKREQTSLENNNRQKRKGASTGSQLSEVGWCSPGINLIVLNKFA